MHKLSLNFALAAAAFAQAPAFEVASIKPSEVTGVITHNQFHMTVGGDAGMLELTNASLADLLRTAFRASSYQISGPAWMTSLKFDIRAKMPGGTPSSQTPEMLQTLLVERFNLVYHREKKDQMVMALLVAKGGSKLHETPSDSPAPPTGGFTRSYGQDGSLRMDITNMTMDSLAEMLGRFLDRPLADQTGLNGHYDLSLNFAPEDIRTSAKVAGVDIPGSGSDEPGTSTIRASLELLGLKMESRKLPVDLLVIDHLERAPTAN